MKKVNRRQFTKMVGGAALAGPLAASALTEALGAKAARAQEAAKKAEAASGAPGAQAPAGEAAKAEPKLKLTAEQEEAVKKAVERRERQLAPMRAHPLAYDAEPAFAFAVRQRPRRPRM